AEAARDAAAAACERRRRGLCARISCGWDACDAQACWQSAERWYTSGERQPCGQEHREDREVEMEQRFLGEILNRRAGVPLERLEPLYAVQREKGIDLVDLLVNGNVIDESTIAQALAAEAELPYVDKVEPDRISTALATRLPITFAKAHKVLVTNEDDFA